MLILKKYERENLKIGGNIVDNPEALQAFLADFRELEGRKVLVHGGGAGLKDGPTAGHRDKDGGRQADHR